MGEVAITDQQTELTCSYKPYLLQLLLFILQGSKLATQKFAEL